MVDIAVDQQSSNQPELDSLTQEEASLYLKLMRLQHDDHDPTRIFRHEDSAFATTSSDSSSSQDNLNLSMQSGKAVQAHPIGQDPLQKPIDFLPTTSLNSSSNF